MQPLVRTLKSKVRLSQELLLRQRNALKRVVSVASNFSEFQKRKRCAEEILRTDLYDIKKFETNGYLKFTPNQTLLQELLQTGNQRLEQRLQARQGTKPFFNRLLVDDDYNSSSIFVRFALDEKILSSVAKYLGAAPFLTSVELIESSPLNGPLTYSQLWHKDRTDKNVVKVLVYLSDVALENGPFTIVPPADSKKVPEYLSHYISDAKLESYIGPNAITPLLGKAGTTHFVDTARCYHMGSRCKQNRLAYFAFYESGFGLGQRRKWIEESGKELSSLRRFALGVPRSG